MLYVEHLRRRVKVFEELARELENFREVSEVISNMPDETPRHLPKVWDGHVRLAAARLAPLCGECASLLLVTRTFFVKWHRGLQDLTTQDRDLSPPDIEASFTNAQAAFSDSDASAIQQSQTASFETSVRFCNELAVQIGHVHQDISRVFAITTADPYTELIERIGTLRGHLKELERMHLGGTRPAEYPSIRDAARFQFAKMIVRLFCDENRDLLTAERLGRPENTTKLHDRLAEFWKTYRLPVERSRNVLIDAIKTMTALGKSAMGRSVLEWWENYHACYECPALNQFEGRDAGDFPQADSAWMSLRHRSFWAVATLARQIRGATAYSDLIQPFREAAAQERAISERIEALVKGLTEWCSSRGHQVLLTGRNRMSAADALELCSALWIADRIGEPWNDRLEQEAFEVVSALQHPDGSFGAVAPLYHNRGFTFYLPSASTIALLARFVTGAASAPRTPQLQHRLKRWAPVLLKGAAFLNETLVGTDREALDDSQYSDWAGWHSDRHPERERIDCLATTEAVIALCRIDDAVKWLINLEVISDFDVSWPEPLARRLSEEGSRLVPVDCEAQRRQLLVRIAPLIRRFKRTGERYTSLWSIGSVDEPLGSHTFVFYGPPGTGKTFSQEIIAGELGWPVVTLTIGNFLHDGEDRVGRRADEVFKRLSYLSNVCIVFDEFDEMVTARARRGDQGWSGFPLLTATMLPLLTLLRERAQKQGCAVSFTTNYIENIDQAAKRVGRLDEAILLTYPDFTSRLLVGLMASRRHKPDVGWKVLLTLAKDTALCSHADARGYIEQGIRHTEHDRVDGMEKPKPPIDASYYRDIDGREHQTMVGLKELFDSIGPKATIDEWLAENESWQDLYARLQTGPNRAEVQRTERRHWPRTAVATGSVSINGSPVRFVDLGQGGFQVETSSDFGTGQLAIDTPLGSVSIRADKRWQTYPKAPGAEVIIGVEVDASSQPDWGPLAKHLGQAVT
jgi:hypothetical protein